MFASVDGANPGYMAHILAPRHVSPPSILGNSLLTVLLNRSVRPSSAETLARNKQRGSDHAANNGGQTTDSPLIHHPLISIFAFFSGRP